MRQPCSLVQGGSRHQDEDNSDLVGQKGLGLCPRNAFPAASALSPWWHCAPGGWGDWAHTHLPLQALIPLCGADTVSQAGPGWALPPAFDRQLGSGLLQAAVQSLRLWNHIIKIWE